MRALTPSRALAALPEAYRAVIILREYEGLKCREIADVLEIPEGTVKWRIAEALSQLAERLQEPLAGKESRVGTKSSREKEDCNEPSQP